LEIKGDKTLFQQLEALGEAAKTLYNVPDFGPRGYAHLMSIARLDSNVVSRDKSNVGRDKPKEIYTFSAVMCWVACDRLAKIAASLGENERELYWSQSAERIHSDIMRYSWSDDCNSLVSTFQGHEIDGYLLLLPELGFIDLHSKEFLSTFYAIEKALRRGNYLLCFPSDLFPSSSATLWYIRMLSHIDAQRAKEARNLFESFLSNAKNNQRILSETLDPATGELWGNFPHSSAMVGIIHCAIELSRPWQALHSKSYSDKVFDFSARLI